jgi:hypothetical protein
MKIAKILGIAFILMVLGALILLPRAIDVKVEKTLDVEKDVAYTLIWNMQNWVAWSPWDKMDSTRKHSYVQGNVKNRIGGEDRFTTSMPENSNGKHVIVDAKVNEYVIMDVYLDKVSMEEPVYRYRFDFESVSEVGGKGTKVTWSLTDTAGFFKIQERFLSMYLNENLSKLFTEGLDNLYEYSKEQEILLQFPRFDIQPNQMMNAIVTEISTSAERDSIEYYRNKIGKNIFNFLKQNSIILRDPPVIIYPEWDKINNKTTMQIGFTISPNQKLDLLEKLPENLKIVDVGSPLITTVEVLPDGKDVEYYYDLLEKYLKMKNFDIIGPRMEVYLGNIDVPGMPKHIILMYPIISKD